MYFFSEITVFRIDEGRQYLFIPPYYFLECIELLSLAFFALIVTTLTTISSFANMKFIKVLTKSDKAVYMNWEKYRSTYVTIIELIDIADNCLCFPVGLCIFAYVIQLTLFSYSYVLYSKGSDKLINSINSAVWNIFLVMSLFIVLWKASSVNTEVCILQYFFVYFIITVKIMSPILFHVSLQCIRLIDTSL